MKVLFIIATFVILCFAADLDGDGFDSDAAFGEFQDCCDTVDDGCFDPFLVNPGAWEVPNNGQADRCIEGRDILNNIPCDSQFIATELYDQFIGPNTIPSETEPAILAMDICEFKDDDDDPSWGFARQENMVFSLVDGTRNGYDIGVIGPNIRQAAVLTQMGNIFPANGKYFLAISTGVARDEDGPNFVAPDAGPAFDTGSDEVNPPDEWRNNVATGNNEATCDRGAAAIDSLMATFAMQQPTNMNGWSVKVTQLDSERVFNNPICTPFETYLIILKNGTVGSPADSNVAIDKKGGAFLSSNSDEDFFTYCPEYANIPGEVICRDSEYHLFGSGFGGLFGTEWIPVGGSADAGEPFQLKFGTWDRGDNALDTTLLFDDYIPIAEKRTVGTDYGYQFTSDIEMSKLTPDVLGIYSADTTTVVMKYTIKNNGPEQTSDVTLNFTPPKGTAFNAIDGDLTFETKVTAAEPYADNSFYKFTQPGNAGLLPVGQSFTGSVTFDIRNDAPAAIQFKFSATCSSIEKLFHNNYLLQMIYIDKL